MEMGEIQVELMIATRLHSTRIHTARLLTSYLPACAGGDLPCQGGLLARGVCLARGRSVLPGGGLLTSGGSALPGGVCLARAGVVSQHAMGRTPPPTHDCENITLPQISFAGGN